MLPRTTLILTLSVLFQAQLCAQQWKWQNPTPGGDYLNGLSFISQARGWTVGNAGVVLHTTDSGNTWTFQKSNSCADMLCVQFISAQEGWIGGSAGTILHTTDAGETWQAQNSGVIADVHSISFISNSEGWMLSGSGVLHTTSGGNSWSLLSSPVSGFCIKFTDPSSGWVGSNFGKIYHTTDGGKKWVTQVSSVSENLLSVSAINGQEAWMAGVPGIIHTSDSGETWSSQTGNCCKFYKSVHFINDRIGWAIGDNVLLRTSNGGKSWKADTLDASLHAVQLTDTTHAMLVGKATIIRVPSPGTQYLNRVSSVSNSSLSSVRFADHFTGWTVGDGGSILKTSDGGKNWKQQASNVNFELTSIYCSSAKDAWITGRAPDTILHTSNGGTDWQVQDSKTSNALNSVFFVNGSSGWAAGYNGTIVHTSNGGTNWAAQVSNTSATLYAICFAGPDTGWAVGEGGVIVRTTNGGANWTTQNSGTASDLYCVKFISLSEGWAAGYGGGLVHTQNGGSKWTSSQVPGAGFPITSVCFVDPRYGWVTSTFPSISYTSDSGKTWTAPACVPQFDPRSIHLLDTTEGWAVGPNGAILHFLNGTPQTSVAEHRYTELSQSIYPNPFSTSAIIRTGIELHHASILIYNTLGQEVKRITSLSGQEITIYRDGLPAGIYFFCLTQDQQALGSGKFAVE